MSGTVDRVPAPAVTGKAARSGRTRRVLLAAAVAVPAATALTAGTAAIARAGGVPLEVPAHGEAIPVSGIAFVTGVLSCVGVLLAVALARWGADPARRFVQATVALTALSLVPPLAVGASPDSVATLVLLHLLAAAVVISALTRALAGHVHERKTSEASATPK